MLEKKDRVRVGGKRDKRVRRRGRTQRKRRETRGRR